MRVVAGFMSPTHASYTSRKMSAADYIDTKTRQQAVALATAERAAFGCILRPLAEAGPLRLRKPGL